MSCDTCGHTVESIGDLAARRVFHCPRCGTMKIETYTGDPNNWHVVVYVPKLVTRCRELGDHVVTDGRLHRFYAWHTLGIEESIRLPEERR